jgi:putative nucleotidyltransferase with HDIG domain
MLARTHNASRASAIRAADRLPLLSSVLHRSIRLLSLGDDVSISDLGAVIEEDAVITGSLLAIANSVMYSRNGSVASVRLAMARLGVNKTRNVLLGLTVSKCFNSVRILGPWSLARFNSHSLAVATLSDLLVQNVKSGNPEWAFMAGLLHDIGLPLLAVGLPEEFRAITANAASDADLVERERELLGFTHFDLGAELLVRWNCPQSVQEAVWSCESAEPGAERPPKLGAIVKTASLIADAIGITTFDTAEDNERTTKLLDALAIPDPLDFIERFKREFSALQAAA